MSYVIAGYVVTLTSLGLYAGSLIYHLRQAQKGQGDDHL